MAADEPAGRSPGADALWADVRIDPVEIALPGGVGFTLRAYRPPTDVEAARPDPDAEPHLDDFDVAAAAVVRRHATEDTGADDKHEPDDEDEPEDDEDERRARSGRGRRAANRADADRDDGEPDGADLEDADIEDADLEDADLEDADGAEAADETGDEDAEEITAEEVPLFLGRKGRLFLFHSPEKLVEFVRSGADNDLTQLDSWPDLVDRIEVDDVVPAPEDVYELDLVVENLRGGADVWDPTLILKAGEVARDLAYALHMPALQSALAPGSPLDDLDEALRAAESGGFGAFFAKRRLRKIPAQQSSLAWRTVIGKISAAADWRD